MISRILMAGLTVGGVLVGASAASAQKVRPFMDLASAETIRDTCLAHAKESGQSIAVSVFDHSGQLVTFAKMDGASTAAAEISKWKGKSAGTYLFSTEQTATWNGPTAPMIATWKGGLPLFDKSGVGVGGVGVSGAPSDFDAECGQKGAEAAGLSTERQ